MDCLDGLCLKMLKEASLVYQQHFPNVCTVVSYWIHNKRFASTYRASSFSISAWEYAAPTTFPPSRGGAVTLLLGVVSRSEGLQKGEAELRSKISVELA